MNSRRSSRAPAAALIGALCGPVAALDTETVIDCALSPQWCVQEAQSGRNPQAALFLARLASVLWTRTEEGRDLGRQARQWWRLALESGTPGARTGYGLALHDGMGGPREVDAGRTWMERGFIACEPESVLTLGVLDVGDPHASAERRRRGAELVAHAAFEGDLRAQALLGQLYWTGTGVERSPGLAYAWAGLAASKGSTTAEEAVRAMARAGGAGVEADGARWALVLVAARKGMAEAARARVDAHREALRAAHEAPPRTAPEHGSDGGPPEEPCE